MVKRIPLDSEFWTKNLTSDMDDPRPELQKLIEMDKPTSKAIEDFLDGLYYVDFPIPQFFLTIPYLLDLFETNPEGLKSEIITFCNFMHKCKDSKPTKRHLTQLESCKERILNLLIACLLNSKGDGYFIHQELIAGIATACGESDLGRHIVGLDPDTPIN